MSFILLVEQAAPETPSANQVVIYPKTDGIMYSKDDAGTERPIAQGIATQAEQEAGTSVAAAVSPGRQQFHPSAAKAWVKFNSAGTVAASYNITSVTDNGVGDWTINIATDFSSANYCGVAFGGRNSGSGNLIYNIVGAAAAGTFRINAYDAPNVIRDPDTPAEIYAVFFGDQ